MFVCRRKLEVCLGFVWNKAWIFNVLKNDTWGTLLGLRRYRVKRVSNLNCKLGTSLHAKVSRVNASDGLWKYWPWAISRLRFESLRVFKGTEAVHVLRVEKTNTREVKASHYFERGLLPPCSGRGRWWIIEILAMSKVAAYRHNRLDLRNRPE